MELDFRFLSMASVVGGFGLFVLVLFQILVGKRKIKFKGATHMKVHRIGGYLLLAGAIGHGVLGAYVLMG